MNPLCKFFVITSDASSHILPVTNHLYQKYIGNTFDYQILCHTIPNYNLNGCQFIPFATNESKSIENWTKKIFNVLSNIEDEYCAFGLDDYLVNQPINKEILSSLFEYMKNDSQVGCVVLGYTPSLCRPNNFKIIKTFDEYDIFELNQDAIYRITCQIKIWRKTYLLRFLQNYWSPWSFENDGSNMAINDGVKIIGSTRKICLDWIEESALSARCPGMINILGLKLDDVKELIDANLLKESNLQFGMWLPENGPIPHFSKYGYNFKINNLEGQVDDYLYANLAHHYGKYYN